jgi:sortase A
MNDDQAATPESTTPEQREALVAMARQQAAAAHGGAPASHQPHLNQQSAAQWQQYHTAWQSYYQQYYERYYMAQLQQPHPPATALASNFQPMAVVATSVSSPDAIRSDLLARVQQHSGRVKSSRHFWPIVSALTVMSLFLLLQFNRLLLAGVYSYVSPGAISPQNIIIDPLASTKVPADPKLIIPKINVEAPVVYGISSLVEKDVQTALKDGVVHYPLPGASSVPGQLGNTVVLGHSSHDVFDSGAYKFVFVQLDRLEKGDTFYLNYLGTRYTYSVTSKEVINPSEVTKLSRDASSAPMATLVTCTPPGTAYQRLAVYGEQISPATSAATQATAATPSSSTNLPGNSPTFFEQLFGR